MECPVPRTSRFAVSRLLRFSVNSRRQPVTARPVHHRCACRGSVRLSVAGAPVYLPGAGAPVCLWIINPLAGGRSPTHSRIFGALLKLRCTWKPFSGGKWSLRAPKFTKCIEFFQLHRRPPGARRCAKCIEALLVHRRPSRASQLFSCTDDRKARQRPGHYRPCAQKTGPEVDASGPESHLLAGDGAVQRWSTTGH